LWAWSKNKSKLQIEKFFMWSPLCLAILASSLSALFSLWELSSEVYFLSKDFPPAIFICLVPAVIAFGYFFIGITAWIYDFLRKRGVIQDEVV
jgi:hypothetical protein